MSLLTQASLLVTPNAYKEGKLYSIIPSNGNGDFTATRATTATRVNAAGLVDLVPYNLLSYSEDFSNGYWSKSNSSIASNTVTAPNGTLTADTYTGLSATSRVFSPSNVAEIGKTYTITIYAKKDSYDKIILSQDVSNAISAVFNLDTGVVESSSGIISSSITNEGNGWYRCGITYVATGLSVLYRIPTGTIFIWGAQLVEGTSARDYLRTETRLNIPRVDYSLGGCPNILLEPQRTNVLLNTVFSGSGAVPTSWTQAVGTGISLLTTSTLGLGAQACSQSATAQRPFLSQSFTLVANTTYSYSIYIESISGVLTNDNILLASGLPAGATTSYFANGVAVSNTALAVVGRLSITIVVSSTGGSAAFRCGIGASSNQTGTLLFSRPQLETGAYSTSFIPTTTASVTRNLDNITRTNVFTNGLITAAGGTWFVELRGNVPVTRDLSTSGIFLNTGVASTIGNGLVLRNPGVTISRIGIFTVVGGALSSNLYTIPTDNAKIAFKWNGTTVDIFVNGVKVVNAAAFTPTAMQNLIGEGANRAVYINEMALFPTPLTDTQCIALTT